MNSSFEVRRPKKVAILAERDGVIAEIREMEGKKKIIPSCTTADGGEERVPYNIPASQNLTIGVEVGATLHKGQLLTEGYLDPQQLLEVEGLRRPALFVERNPGGLSFAGCFHQ